MDMSKLPDDFVVTFHQFTKTAYRDVYPSIEPSSPDLSQEGKVVIITGASKGIGRYGLAAAFAKANAKAIVLVARSAEQLAQTEEDLKKINSKVDLLSVPADLTDESSIEALFEKVKSKYGTADVLVNNAGGLSEAGPIASADSKAWWFNMEVNVRGTFLMTKSFLKLVGSEKPAVVINMSSGAALHAQPGMSGYAISKLAVSHMVQYVAAENPNVTAIAADPGAVATEMTTGFFQRFAKDTPALSGGFCVWLCTEKAKFLSGRHVGANWSVDELLERKDEIVNEGKLLTGLNVKLGLDNIQ
ncbi:MAG: hypothetical protein M1823_004942 [Watsoniomyces obsoletus]|nr:MAG: hypothetical protein M1823_004942 [Watsoniomyces obsoletus]